MKILFINSTHYDYMQDILFSGLVKHVGIENIKTIPLNKSYFLATKEYPKNLGYNKGVFPKLLWNSIKNFKYDCVIVGSAKKKSFEIYNSIAHKIPSSTPVVFIDGGDVDWIGGDLKRKNCFELYEKAISIRPFDLVFKREMIIGREYDKNVFPCPFAFNLDRISSIPKKSKIYNLSFWAVESHKIRTDALTLIQDKFDCKLNGTSLNQKFKLYKRKGDFYLEELKRSNIVLNFRGGGWDTLRFWEVPALETFMISQKPQIVIPDEFENGKNIIYCKDDLSDLLDLIQYYLIHDTEREKIVKESFAHLKKFHTDEKRAKYVVEIIKGFIK